MAEELHAGICEGTWWKSSKTMLSGFPSSSPTEIADLGISFGWATNMADDIEARSSNNKEKHQQAADSHNNGSSVFIDSSLKMMDFDLSSTPDCNQSFQLSCRQEPVAMDSALLQGLLFEPDAQAQQHSLNFNNRSINHMPAGATYGANANGILSPPWPKLAPFVRPSLPKQLPSSLPLPQSQVLLQTFENKLNCPRPTIETNTKQVRNLASVMKKGSGEPPLKRPRIETPLPLPTFKVRKEKLGDRITALQQLVSPFGKTDTASVLHETIEYIKFLHDQVNVLSTPYVKQAAVSIPQGIDHRLKDTEGSKQDLRSRGLCLVPISTTFTVANETTADFWTPAFVGTLR
ncbi:hypothetical protein ES319_D09G080800v1 [Gossypium barbadense]|uniref:BHLH domain-containing protein n=1 Tax=Gossypium barbadense TaxID=3634 RepID=A0A5J5Q5J7_GOSBA|nr:transcription factor bHLH112 isoform X1 [Gossypium raimondii]KAB2012311.1 hypothetical protein ES319_D09G080800v1 [Gossypium barbadense]